MKAMREPLEVEYFNWLCAKILRPRGRMYHDLLYILYCTEFVWVVPADKHRISDGIELRENFFRYAYLKKDYEFLSQPCSVLEVLYAFAQRAQFQTDLSTRKWFWTFMENLQLDQFRQVTDDDRHIIDEVIGRFMWRTYEPNGHGGLFPLRWPKKDQREVELWYQFFEYLDDRGLL